MQPPRRSPPWSSLAARAVLHTVLLSAPFLLLGFLTVHQARDVANKVDAIFHESATSSAVASEALAKLAEASYYARNNDRSKFEISAKNFNLLMKALAWGTDTPVFQRDDGGELQKQWQAFGWQESIGAVKASEEIRGLAAKTSFYYQGYSKFILEGLSEPQPDVVLKKAIKYEYLVVQNLRRLLDEILQDSLRRRQNIEAIRLQQTKNLFLLSVLFFLIVMLSTWAFSYMEIVKPIVNLTRQLEKVRIGDMSARLPLNSQNEIGVLAHTFNQLIEDLDKTTVSRDVLAREVGERKRVEAKLRQSEKMSAVGELAGGIAHDLNNGLTPVLGYLDMLLIEEGLNQDAKVMLAEAKQSTLRCSEVVQKLMDFSRSTTQVKSRLEVGKLLADLKKMLRPVFPATITVEVEYPEDIGSLYANETDLSTVLMNLAINARDAMTKSGGKLTLKASNVGDKVFLCASDTGMGMSPEVVPHIFEPFFTTKSKGHGTGLGLAMVYNIIKEHGGTIEVSSQMGKGTSFYIYLPRHLRGQDAAGVPSASNQAASSTGIHKGAGNVLFVDDEPVLRNMGKIFLERLGYTVFLAEDGEEALKIYQQNHAKIVVVVLDMTMPKLSGLETVKGLLAVDPGAKIVLASGYTAEGSTKDLLSAGAKAFIQKPYTMGSLAQTLQKVLGSVIE